MDMLTEDELPPPVPRGMTNLGNTCYMNAVLQALAHCPPLTHYLRCCTALYRPLLDKGGRGKPDARTKMTTAFTDAVCELLKGGPEASQTPVRPLELLDAVSELMPTFRRHEQQDAHELLRLVLQQSHEQLLRPLAEAEVSEDRERLRRRWKAATQEEWKDVEAAQRDKERRAWEAAQKKGLYSAPPREPETPQTVLALQLKRFRNLGGVGRKAAEPVTFPLQLNMRAHLAAAQPDGHYDYELCAVVVHHGASLSSGHYTAYVRGVDGARRTQWYLKDDARSVAVAAEDVLKAEAYLLFYCRIHSETHLALCHATMQAVSSLRPSPIVSLATPPPPDAALLSRGWLARLLSSDDPGPVGMQDVLCKHMQARWRPSADPRDVSHQAAAACVWAPHATWCELRARFQSCPPAGRPLDASALRACAECETELAKEREEITRMDSTSVKPGEAWFIIDSAWLAHWREYAITGSRPDPPGPIANWRLLSHGRGPRQNLLRVRDYRGVNRQVWQVFHRRYGGGPPICRGEINLYGPPVTPPTDVPQLGPPV